MFLMMLVRSVKLENYTALVAELQLSVVIVQVARTHQAMVRRCAFLVLLASQVVLESQYVLLANQVPTRVVHLASLAL